MTLKDKSISFILTSFNDQADTITTIKKILQECKNYKVKSEIILIVDGENELIKKSIKVNSIIRKIIYRKNNSGLASAINLGIIKSSYRYIAWMDSGMTYLVKKYFDSIIFLDKANLIIFSRYRGGLDQRVFRRKIGSYLINKFCRYLLGKDISDYTSGLFIIDSDLLNELAPINRGYGEYFIEFLYKIKNYRYVNIKEIPYVHENEELTQSNSYEGFLSYIFKGFYYFLFVIRIRLFT